MKFSFVLLSYNQQDFIAEAVRAALAQQGPPMEIVLSDDCSSDRTFEIMQAIVSEYSGPHHVILNRNETNIGVNAHIRRANTISTGDVMIAASGDDISLPERSLRIREVFETSQAWLVHSHAECIDLTGREIAPVYLGADLLQDPSLTKLATSGSLYLGATAAFHRSLFEKYGYVKNPHAYEDLVYGFRATLENGVRFIDRPLLKYRVGSGISTKAHSDPVAKQAATIKNLKAQLAVLAQRRRDALLFGLRQGDPVLRAIRNSRLKALLRLIFWKRSDGRKINRLVVQHPWLAFSAWQSVRRKRKKLDLTPGSCLSLL